MKQKLTLRDEAEISIEVFLANEFITKREARKLLMNNTDENNKFLVNATASDIKKKLNK